MWNHMAPGATARCRKLAQKFPCGRINTIAADRRLAKKSAPFQHSGGLLSRVFTDCWLVRLGQRRHQAPHRSAAVVIFVIAVVGFGPPIPIARGQIATPQTDANRQGTVLTLSRAADAALANNPAIRKAASANEEAAARLGEVRAARLPSLQFGETFIRSDNPVFVFGSLLEQGRFTSSNFNIQSLNHPDALDNFRTAFSFSLPIYDQKQTTTRIAEAKDGQQQSALAEERTEQELRLAVIKTYYGLVLAQARKVVAAETVTSAEAEVKQIQDRLDSGMIVQSDLLAAQVQLSEFKQDAIRADGDVTAAQATLCLTMGLPVDNRQAVVAELPDRTFQTPGQGDQTQFIATALRERPDLKSARLRIHSTESGLQRARGEYLPKVDFFANYGISGQGLASGDADYTIGARVTVNLFDAGRKARIEEARASRSEARAEQDELEDQARLEVVRAYQEFLAARQRVEVAGQAINQATETLRIVQDRYQEGLTTITEVLRAQTASARARLSLLLARYDYCVGYANLLMASGILTGVGEFG